MRGLLVGSSFALIALSGCKQAADLADEQEQRKEYELASERAAEAHANNPVRKRLPEDAVAYLHSIDGEVSEEDIESYRLDVLSALIAEGVNPGRADASSDRFAEKMQEIVASDYTE